MDIVWNIIYLFIGSALTFYATYRIEEKKGKRTIEDQQARYQVYVRLQLGSVLKVLSKLKYSYENNRRYLPRDMQLLEKALEPLNVLRVDTNSLKKGDKQEELIDVIADLNLYITDIRAIDEIDPYLPRQALPTGGASTSDAQTAPNSTVDDNRDEETANLWLAKNVELIDIRRRVEELIKALS